MDINQYWYEWILVNANVSIWMSTGGRIRKSTSANVIHDFDMLVWYKKCFNRYQQKQYNISILCFNIHKITVENETIPR